MKRIDRDSWPRNDIYSFFQATSNPFYAITFEQDITDLYRFVKQHSLSFYYSMIYVSTKAVNRVEAFRYSILDGNPVLFDFRIPSFTDLKTGSELFHVVTLPCDGTIFDFCQNAWIRSIEQTSFMEATDEKANLISFSCVPWVRLTGLLHDRNFRKEDCIPRITWGKYELKENRVTIGICLEVNHCFVDGLHIGMFAKALTDEIAKLTDFSQDVRTNILE